VDRPSISYATRPDSTPEAEIATLVNIYSFVLNSANKNAAGVTSTNGGDEKERPKNDSLASNDSTT
jgi:hypothetical protein